jgi:hypothetical protein
VVDLSKLQKHDARKFITVELEGLGTIRLASFSARRALEFRKLLKRQSAGEDVELEMTRLMIVGSLVDDEGKAVFDDAGADAFMDRISPNMAGKLVVEVTKLQGEEARAVDPANPSQPSTTVA